MAFLILQKRFILEHNTLGFQYDQFQDVGEKLNIVLLSNFLKRQGLLANMQSCRGTCLLSILISLKI